MISEASQFGGSMSVATSTTLTMASPRLVRCVPPSSMAVTLPSIQHHLIQPNVFGGPRFTIINHSNRTVTVRQPDLTTLLTLGTNQVGIVSLAFQSDTAPWTGFTRSLNAARTVGYTTRVAVTNPDTAATFDPSNLACFVGQDCELANAIPLVAENDTPSVLAPMYINPCPGRSGYPHGGNEDREAVRGADVIMPSAVVVRFQDEFSPDPLHPLAGQLSAEALAAMVNNGSPHILAFDEDAELENATSRNPYHIGRNAPVPGGWSFGSFNVTKHFWKKRIEYDVGEETYHVDIVFQMQHTADPQPRLTANGGSAGGACNDEAGAWGALFCIYVFTDELLPDFEDEDTHTPTGGSSPVEFSRHDPLVWGNAPGVSGGDDNDKFCHPQLLVAAMLPTTLHDPCPFQWIPLLDREFIRKLDGGQQPAYNREWAYRRPNCAPWVTNPNRDLPNLCTDCTTSASPLGTIVFNPGTTSKLWRAMSTGGGCPVSRPTEYLVFENGLATVRTYLTMQRAGWDEEVGVLTEDVGSSGTISLCIGGPNGNAPWPDYDIQCCDGHPAEPWQGVGGGHGCFRTHEEGAETECCVTLDLAIAFWYQICVSIFAEFGERSVGTCVIEDVGCKEKGSFWTQRGLEVYDYSLGPEGDSIPGRYIIWKRYLLDPRAELWHYTYDPGEVDDVEDMVGTWTLGATVSPSTYNAAKTIKAIVSYNPTRGSNDGAWRDAAISFTAMAATQTSHGAGMRVLVFGDNAYGIFAFLVPTGVDTGLVKIVMMNNDAETVLASQEIVLDNDEVDIVFTVWGYEYTVAWEVAGGESGSLTANDCTYHEGGVPVLATQHNTTPAEFANWVIVDNSNQFLPLGAELRAESSTLNEASLELMYGYGKCDTITNNGCGTCCEPEICNCKSEAEQLYSSLLAVWAGPGNPEGLPEPTNPTYLGGPFHNLLCYGNWCPPATYYCGECPHPFPAANFVVPRRCWGKHSGITADNEPKICKGLTSWYSTNLTCENPEVVS